MNKKYIYELLEDIKAGKVSVEEGASIIEDFPYTELGYAKIDNHREVRTGYPEIIYCKEKQISHIVGIVKKMQSQGERSIMGTRATREVYEALKDIAPNIKFYPDAAIFHISREEITPSESTILVVSAGTSDHSVAEEAAVTAEIFGNKVDRLYDVGVAGIHRLLANIEKINSAKVVICVAGMDAALLSVVGGIAKSPVIGVPTSVGYGAAFEGVSALLAMLNSCASGTTVVNIDNGFGAAYFASIVNKQ